MRITPFLIVALLASTLLGGCDKPKTEEQSAESELPPITPDLPEVPTLPPPPFAIRYEDGSHSVYGLFNRRRHAIDTEVSVTGYIVEVFEPPVCKEKKKENCPEVKAPHIWLADTPNESDHNKSLIVVGYADNTDQIEKARRSPNRKLEEGQIAVPTDFAVGNKVKVRGKYAYLSNGFNSSTGLLEYLGHDTLKKAE
ncbi:MAG: hypothetical protein R3A47_10830 [Polyangiales bacterium]